MGIRFFRGDRTRFEHEFRQLEEIVSILKKEFVREPVYVLTNVLVANGQLDCVLLTRTGPLILELKAFQGEIHGVENGSWEVITADGPIPLPNLFLQVRNRRQDLIDRLIPIYRKILPHISDNTLRKMSSWLYFSRGSTYPDGQIDQKRVKWFRVVTADTFMERMRFLDTGYTLRLQDMDAIVEGLHLQEYNFENDRPLSPMPAASRPAFHLTRGHIVVIVVLIFFAGLALLILTVPGARLTAVAFYHAVGAMIAGLIQAGSGDISKSETTAAESQAAIIYLNQVRVAGGAHPLVFDERAYRLALNRSTDMSVYRYLGYINPMTGISAADLTEAFGFHKNDTISECAYGQWNGYTYGIERLAVDSWSSDLENRQRLFRDYNGSAIACSGGYCSFIGFVEVPEINQTSNLTAVNSTWHVIDSNQSMALV